MKNKTVEGLSRSRNKLMVIWGLGEKMRPEEKNWHIQPLGEGPILKGTGGRVRHKREKKTRIKTLFFIAEKLKEVSRPTKNKATSESRNTSWGGTKNKGFCPFIQQKGRGGFSL